MVHDDSGRIPRAPPYSGSPLAPSAISSTGLSPSPAGLPMPFPCRSFRSLRVLQPHLSGLGSSVFARRYSRNRSYFLFLQVLRCFSSLRSPRRGYVFTTGCPCHARTGSPIRISAVLCVPAAPRCVSPLAASFFACVCLGIRRKPLLP